MVTDLVQIRRLGEQKFEENHRFRRYLKVRGFVERRFRHIAQEIEDQIDCTQCANCCKVATTTVAGRDVERLARFLRIRKEEFLQRYTDQSPDEGLILKRTEAGCIFLDGLLCSVYEARPGTCTGYPHLVRGAGSLISRLWQFVDRASCCPIVYNTLEAWKKEVRFLSKLR